MNPKVKFDSGDGCVYHNPSKGVVGASNVAAHVSRRNDSFSPEEISKMEDLYKMKGKELAAMKGLAARMSNKKELVESQVKKLNSQMEDREVACAEVKMGLWVAIDELNVHKYNDNFLEPTAMLTTEGMGLPLCKLRSQEDATRLDALIREVKCHQKTLAAFKQKVVSGKIKYQLTCKEYEDVELDRTKVLHSVEPVRAIRTKFCSQLERMRFGFGVSTFPLPIIHPCRQKDSRNVILIKACPICQEWFTTNDIIVASCGHTYHPFCLYTHFQSSDSCAVEFCHEPFLHPDWWLSMGINPLLEEQIVAATNMGLEDNNGCRRNLTSSSKKVRITPSHLHYFFVNLLSFLNMLGL